MNEQRLPEEFEHFEDKQKVKLKETGETVTVNEWSITKFPGNIQQYTYTIIEYPGTFFYHRELEKI
ncbi:hypothetical protein [Paenibacillus sp. 1A_MP2]|uniref:hypothetical protein n=1 Tax=Paenibacillus sp. 1A_MP2 TaxID=3457495 RepID=UPI003FCE93CB